MSSSIFYKFKSQKDVSQISFDGTSLSVFELKRDIIAASRLGDGTDFDFEIHSPDTNEKYDDDTTLIPRSSTVIARRLPASKQGAGRAARYVSGKMPIMAKNQHRVESSFRNPAMGKGAPLSSFNTPSAAMSEADRLNAMNAQYFTTTQADNFAQDRSGPRKPFKRNAPPREGPPPPGYVCHRCGQKGHWIQECPTNDDPNFENRPKIKKTTGIPRSMLQVVERPEGVDADGKIDVSKLPPGVMYTAQGEWVIAKPDEEAWKKVQEQSKAAKELEKVAATGSQELRDKGLECEIDKHIFVQPMMTPCCGKTYCFNCIENALLESDFVCPNCSTGSVLVDDLKTDDDMQKNVYAYEDEKIEEKKRKDRETSKSPNTTATTREDNGPPAANGTGSAASTPQSTKSNPRKRSADEELPNNRIPTGPAAMQNGKLMTSQPPTGPKNQQDVKQQMDAIFATMSSVQAGMPAFANPMMSMPGMGFPMGMGMNMPGMMPGMNPFMMQQMQQNMGMNMGFNPQQQRGANMMPGGNMMPNGGYGGQQQWQGQQGWNNGVNGMNGGMQNNAMMGNFPNQNQQGNQSDAYFRKPVNPHRHQGKNRKQRSADYREV